MFAANVRLYTFTVSHAVSSLFSLPFDKRALERNNYSALIARLATKFIYSTVEKSASQHCLYFKFSYKILYTNKGLGKSQQV